MLLWDQLQRHCADVWTCGVEKMSKASKVSAEGRVGIQDVFDVSKASNGVSRVSVRWTLSTLWTQTVDVVGVWNFQLLFVSFESLSNVSNMSATHGGRTRRKRHWCQRHRRCQKGQGARLRDASQSQHACSHVTDCERTRKRCQVSSP